MRSERPSAAGGDAPRGTVRDLSMRCKDVFVYFKHEDEGKGAEFGRMLQEMLRG